MTTDCGVCMYVWSSHHCLWFVFNAFLVSLHAINVNEQYNGGFLPDIILWTQCYLHRGTCFNAM